MYLIQQYSILRNPRVKTDSVGALLAPTQSSLAKVPRWWATKPNDSMRTRGRPAGPEPVVEAVVEETKPSGTAVKVSPNLDCNRVVVDRLPSVWTPHPRMSLD